MAGRSTRDALLEEGALLFARHGVTGVSVRKLHEAVGARNESALQYHFGSRENLAQEILRRHLQAVEDRRARLVSTLIDEERTEDLRSVVNALAEPMACDLDTGLGRAHLRLVAQLSFPSLAYQRPFRFTDAPAGLILVRWLVAVLAWLPPTIRLERLAALRTQLIGMFAQRAQLIDDASPDETWPDEFFLANLLDLLVAGLEVAPSQETVALAPRHRKRGG